jgi:hypothetical protein
MRVFIKKYVVALVCALTTIFLGCEEWSRHQVEENYGSDVEKYALQYQLPEHYLKALIVLESSGKKDVRPRFEKKVYQALKAVQRGKRTLEKITANDLKDCNDEALRNLASSWGPFQLMGYKCLQLGIQVSDLRGNDAVKWAIHWINLTYGDYLRQEKFEEAFRIHNTGSPNGRTFDPNYVKNGMKSMKMFE